MKLIRTLLLTAMVATPLLAQTPAAPATESWGIDKSHSTTTFKVRHMMANVVGQFRDFDANINVDRANLANSTVEFTIQATSIDTGNTNRDEHLRSADFFEVAKFPTITFKSTSIKAKSKDSFDVTGDFTMHGVTKRITIPVTFLGFGKDGRGNEKAGLEIETTVNRKDYGVVWNRNLDEGGVLLGDDVKVSINLEVAKKKV
ncbi:MAG TPA: YceI family protein [Thermoanaerobaculia bacterium]